MHDHLYDRLWGWDGVHPFGNPFFFRDFLQEYRINDLEREELEQIMKQAVEEEDYRKAADIQRIIKSKPVLEIIRIPDNISVNDLATFLSNFPEGKFKFVVYEA